MADPAWIVAIGLFRRELPAIGHPPRARKDVDIREEDMEPACDTEGTSVHVRPSG